MPLYDKARQAFLDGDLNWTVDVFNAVLIDTDDYSPDLLNDEFFSEVAGAAQIASGTLASKTVTDGVADAADLLLSTVAGDQSEAILIVQQTASDTTSRLVCLITVATGLPVTPSGGDITISWDPALSGSAPGIFKL